MVIYKEIIIWVSQIIIKKNNPYKMLSGYMLGAYPARMVGHTEYPHTSHLYSLLLSVSLVAL